MTSTLLTLKAPASSVKHQDRDRSAKRIVPSHLDRMGCQLGSGVIVVRPHGKTRRNT
jgi:hypothetical protein